MLSVHRLRHLFTSAETLTSLGRGHSVQFYVLSMLVLHIILKLDVSSFQLTTVRKHIFNVFLSSTNTAIHFSLYFFYVKSAIKLQPIA